MMDAEDLCLYHKPLTGGGECLLIKSGYCDNFPPDEGSNLSKGSVWAGGCISSGEGSWAWVFSVGRNQPFLEDSV